jgi:hypothetical protein
MCAFCGYSQKDTEIYYDDDETAKMQHQNFFNNQRQGINGSDAGIQSNPRAREAGEGEITFDRN